jgi:tetratricopeptide (TPR) repeat protein
MNSRLILALAAFAIVSPLAVAPVLAAGSGGDSVPACKKGMVYDKKSQKCVKQAAGGVIDDESLYDTGRQLALAGDYDEAIKVLSLSQNKNDARVLTYLGYAHRKSGRVAVGIGYYHEALRADPGYVPVREYLGEAHLQQGDVDGARQQLAEIEKRVGTQSAEYKELSAQIAAYKAG